MPDEMRLVQIQLLAEPGAELHQGGVGLVVEPAGFVRVADLDGNGVDVPLIGGGGFFVQGYALHDFPFQPHDKVRADLHSGGVEIVAVGFGGGIGIAHVMDGR